MRVVTDTPPRLPKRVVTSADASLKKTMDQSPRKPLREGDGDALASPQHSLGQQLTLNKLLTDRLLKQVNKLMADRLRKQQPSDRWSSNPSTSCSPCPQSNSCWCLSPTRYTKQRFSDMSDISWSDLSDSNSSLYFADNETETHPDGCLHHKVAANTA
jgi:hypothetical protein